MNKKEKMILISSLITLANVYDIKDNELGNEFQLNKMDKEFKCVENKKLFTNKEDFKRQISGLFQKYVNNL